MSNLIIPRRTAMRSAVDEQFGARFAGRMKTRDSMTFDQARSMGGRDSGGGQSLGGAYRTHDGLQDIAGGRYRTVDSTGAFLVGELERLDMTLHEPLVSVTWGRDIDLREDVTLADEVSSYTVSTYASAGGLGAGNSIGNGKAWMGKKTNQVSGVGVDIGKIVQPLTPWALELAYTILELESAAKTGRPIDVQKYNALKLKHQMDIDEMVYIGDTSLGMYGLWNSNNRTGVDQVTNVSNVVAGASGQTQWTGKTADEILSDFNSLIVSVWAASGYALMPGKIALPPAQFGYISTEKVSQAGNVSILKYVKENNVMTAETGGQLEIVPSKWLVGAGVGGTVGTLGTVDRMVAYTQEKDRVRYPMTMLNSTPIQYDSVYHKSTYYGRLGVLEIVYPETIGYRDAI